jgi:hypothetical protein
MSDKEGPMRKVVYGVSTATTLLIFAVLVVHQPHSATASIQSKASDIVDVHALEAKIDVKALPRQDILSEADE